MIPQELPVTGSISISTLSQSKTYLFPAVSTTTIPPDTGLSFCLLVLLRSVLERGWREPRLWSAYRLSQLMGLSSSLRLLFQLPLQPLISPNIALFVSLQLLGCWPLLRLLSQPAAQSSTASDLVGLVLERAQPRGFQALECVRLVSAAGLADFAPTAFPATGSASNCAESS